MRVLNFNCDGHAIGGASIAALRIAKAMVSDGELDVVFACVVDPHERRTVRLARSFCGECARFLSKCMSKALCGSVYSTGLFPSGVVNKINLLNSDAVVLHAIQFDSLSMLEVGNIKGVIFWYHHDLWPIRGITAYEWFKVPRRLMWLDRLAQWNKRRVARQMGNRLVPVCASQWVADEIYKSGMYSHEPIVIPLPLDEVFKPGARNPSVKFRILNGARGGFAMGIKGGDRLLAALERIPENEKRDMEVVVFGSDGADEVRNGVPIRFVGRLEGETLAQVYRDADVFAFPSRQETFGQTKIEALACGTPVVAFDETACAEGIQHKINGWIAAADDSAGFAEGIRYFYQAWKDGRSIRVVGDSAYSSKVVAQKWIQAIENEVKADAESKY